MLFDAVVYILREARVPTVVHFVFDEINVVHATPRFLSLGRCQPGSFAVASWPTNPNAAVILQGFGYVKTSAYGSKKWPRHHVERGTREPREY